MTKRGGLVTSFCIIQDGMPRLPRHSRTVQRGIKFRCDPPNLVASSCDIQDGAEGKEDKLQLLGSVLFSTSYVKPRSSTHLPSLCSFDPRNVL